MKLKDVTYIVFCAIGLIACEPEFDNPIEESEEFTSGEADFSNYVALGNSITAGLASNALFISGQENSFPNILATTHFAATGGGDFVQPLVANNAGGLLLNGMPIQGRRLVLAVDEDGNRAPREFTGQEIQTEVSTILTGPFNNMGVPGAKSYHLVAPGYGSIQGLGTPIPTANPYFVRFASSPSTTILADALAQNPTFFSLWIGNNDILGYAVSGGTGVDQTGNLDPTTYGPNDITDPDVFAGVYRDVVTRLTGAGAKGVLVTIPDVTSIPFFTTVPFNPIPLDAATAAGTNAAYAQYNGGLQAAFAALNGTGLFSEDEVASRTINFSEGQNAVVIFDENLTDLGAINPAFAALPKIRQATPEDLLVLTSSSVIGTRLDPADPATTIGVGVPLEDKWVLTPSEQEEISTALTSYNNTIETIADTNELALYDANAALAEVAATGVSFNGGTVTATFGSGGAFSLDGVHPTPRVHAIVANGIARAIENTYRASLPSVDPGDYGTITLSNEVN
ncbi:G-D-S-L family lipolytic protein [Aquimarina sp. ERC-38]|uniref:G-D-S-L family lipolytic protein n=1 Tax=Aquimarina sp. ERC-38 TaxID=2949996 RepID=UPI0022473C90|nr:G-D-S-L family lipolytic protein [Aquimarina sp. ERC-38]UZO81174.1 G-D-S-L family lipolytic protein [Aquimarina sp. ERC-38]